MNKEKEEAGGGQRQGEMTIKSGDDEVPQEGQVTS
jgi:hypothetical protein